MSVTTSFQMPQLQNIKTVKTRIEYPSLLYSIGKMSHNETSVENELTLQFVFEFIPKQQTAPSLAQQYLGPKTAAAMAQYFNHYQMRV